MYHTALAHYRHHEWNEAEIILKKLLASDHRRKIYKLYLERIENYRKNPPLDDWEDITVFTHK